MSVPVRMRKTSGTVMTKSPSRARAATNTATRARRRAQRAPACVRRAGRRPARRRARRPAGDRRVGRHDGAHSAPIRPRRTSSRKTGAPTTAVMMPTCTSPGGSTTRPTHVGAEDQHGAVRPCSAAAPGGSRDPRRRARRAARSGRRRRSGRPARSRCRRAARWPGRSTSRSTADAAAEAAGQVVAEGEGVEAAHRGQAEHGADDEERQPDQEHVGAAAADGADRPEPERLDGLAVGEQHGLGPAGDSAAVTAAPAMAIFIGVAPSRPSRGDDVHEDHRDRGAREARTRRRRAGRRRRRPRWPAPSRTRRPR